ncbi:MAG: WD40 repeat domain-containing protein [Candidatus Nanohaloarchaea archaeon]
MELKTEKHHIAAGIGLLILIGFAITNAVGQVSPQQSGEYNLNVTTDPVTNVKETEATFQATVDQLDADFDAALVYWNYSQDNSLSQRGPANIAFNEEQLQSLTSGLSPDTGYSVEAYAEPVIWGDTTLEENLDEKLSRGGIGIKLFNAVSGNLDTIDFNNFYASTSQEGREALVSEFESNNGELPTSASIDLGRSYNEISSTTLSIDADNIEFSSNGSYMYIENSGIYQYRLSTPWDINTAGERVDTTENGRDYAFMPNGSGYYEIYINYDDETEITYHSLSTPWDLTTANYEYQEVLSKEYSNIDFSPDGSKMILARYGDEVSLYELSEPWDINTASFVSSKTSGLTEDINSIHVSKDGSKLILVDSAGGATMNEYEMSAPWDVSTATQIDSITPPSRADGLTFSPDGSKMATSSYDGYVATYDFN